MNIRYLVASIGLVMFVAGSIQSREIGSVSAGRLIVHKDFSSDFVAPRDVFVWLPEEYTRDTTHPVVYVHDGQSLFYADSSNDGFANGEWGLDETASALIASGKVVPFIAVGIANSPFRHSEYFPAKVTQRLTSLQKDFLISRAMDHEVATFSDPPKADAYLKFIVKELMPAIEGHYSVATGPENTVLMGASMGGLISLYGLVEYPETFGGAVCISSNWPGITHRLPLREANNNPIPPAIYRYLQAHLPRAGKHTIYFDFGTQGLDALYPPLQKEVDGIMRNKGYTANDWMTFRDQGAEHSEAAWQARLHRPLQFILSPRE